MFCPQVPTRSLFVPVTHDPSRKEFFAKLAGLAAGLTILPRLFRKNGVDMPAAPTSVPDQTFTAVRTDPRVVARRDARG